MTATLDFLVTDAQWLEVASGSAHVLIQRQSTKAVRVHVGASEPANDAPAIILADDRREFPLDSLAPTDKVFVAAVEDYGHVVVLRS